MNAYMTMATEIALVNHCEETADVLLDIQASKKMIGQAQARPILRAMLDDGLQPESAMAEYSTAMTSVLVRREFDLASMRAELRECFKNAGNALKYESPEVSKCLPAFKLTRASETFPQTRHNGRLAVLSKNGEELPAHFSVGWKISFEVDKTEVLGSVDDTPIVDAAAEAIAAVHDDLPSGQDVVTTERLECEAYGIGRRAALLAARECYNRELSGAQELYLQQKAEIAKLKAELASRPAKTRRTRKA
jgi:hypothetical protein